MAAPHIEKLSVVEYGSKAHRVEDLSWDVLEAKVYENTGQFPLSQQSKPRVGGLFGKFGFTEQLVGSGTAGTPPPVDALLKALPMTYANVPATSDTYTVNPLSAQPTAFTLDKYAGNAVKYSQTSCMLTAARLMLRHGEPGKLQVEGNGLYVAPTEAAGAAALATQGTVPVCKTLSVSTFGGDNMTGLKELTIDFNPSAPPRESMGSGSTQGYLAPKAVNVEPTLELLYEFLDYSAANYYTDFTSETGLVLAINMGSAAGSNYTIAGTFYMNAVPEITPVEGIFQVRLRARMGWASGEPIAIAFV